MLRILYYCLKFWHLLKTENEALVTNKTSILFSAKKRKSKGSLWLHRAKKTPKVSTESKVQTKTPLQTKNVLIKPNSTELKRAS